MRRPYTWFLAALSVCLFFLGSGAPPAYSGLPGQCPEEGCGQWAESVCGENNWHVHSATSTFCKFHCDDVLPIEYHEQSC